jgi:hypothetical protein
MIARAIGNGITNRLDQVTLHPILFKFNGYIFKLGSILLFFEGTIWSFWYTRVSLDRSLI